MSCHEATYDEIIHKVRAGDVMAFRGTKTGSNASAPGRPVSHVGVVFDAAEASRGPLLIEATTEKEGDRQQKGVEISDLWHEIRTYEGTCWWLPLSESSRLRFNRNAFQAFCSAENGRGFDLSGGIKVSMREQAERWRA